MLERIGYTKSKNLIDYEYLSYDMNNIYVSCAVIENYTNRLSKIIEEKNIAKTLADNPEYLKEKIKIEKELKEKENERKRVLRLIEDDKLKRLFNMK